MTTKMLSQRKLRIGSAVAAALAVGMLAARVGAYTVNGPAWGSSHVTYYVNPQNKYVTDAEALNAVKNAAASWTGVANVILDYGGTTSNASLSLDGVNAVFFRDDAPGAIATTYWWYDSSNRFLDADIVFHENYRFYTGNVGCNGDGFYVENTGAHEFGHMLGLGHSAVDVATMWPYSGNCELIRETPDADDIAGLRSIYPGAAPTPTTAPAAPSTLIVAASAANPSGSLVLSWTDNASNEAGYRVERSTDGATFATIAQLAADSASYVDSGLPAAATFTYRVAGYNSAGASYSNVASAQTAAATPTPASGPTAPASPMPIDGAINVNTNVTLAWTATSATRYDVYVNDALRGRDLTTASFKPGGLAAGTRYTWLVVAKNANGTTSGPTWTFTTKAAQTKGPKI